MFFFSKFISNQFYSIFMKYSALIEKINKVPFSYNLHIEKNLIYFYFSFKHDIDTKFDHLFHQVIVNCGIENKD